MSLFIPTRTTDHVKIIADGDEALDLPRPPQPPPDGADDEVKAAHTAELAAWLQTMAPFLAYFCGEDTDASKVPLRPDCQPVWWTLRPLNARELAICRRDGGGHLVAFQYLLARFGVVAVEGDLGDWKPRRETYCGVSVLTQECVSDIGHAAVVHIANVVLRLSQPPPGK